MVIIKCGLGVCSALKPLMPLYFAVAMKLVNRFVFLCFIINTFTYVSNVKIVRKVCF